MNSEKRSLLVRGPFSFNEALIKILKARSGSLLCISQSCVGKHVLTRPLTGGKVREYIVKDFSPLS